MQRWVLSFLVVLFCSLIPRKGQPPLEGINAFCREISNVYTWYTCRLIVKLLLRVLS